LTHLIHVNAARPYRITVSLIRIFHFGGISMSNAVSNNNQPVQNPAGVTEDYGSRMQNIVIGIIVFGAAALLAYQFLGCASCYMPI
jgi:hypothetical protein